MLAADPARGRASWEPLAELIAKGGVSALLVQPREVPAGHPVAPAADEIDAARKWLAARSDVRPGGIVLAGDGIAALAALAEAAKEPKETAGLVLLSASIDQTRLDDSAALADYGARPLFLGVSRGDKRAAKSALVLDAESGAEQSVRKLFVSPGATAGPALLEGDGTEELLRWIRSVTSSAPE